MTALTATEPVSAPVVPTEPRPPVEPPRPGRARPDPRALARSWGKVAFSGAGKSLRWLSTKTAPILRPVTILGWVVLASALILFVLGRWGGWAELVVAALCLVGAFVASLAFVVGRSNYSVELDLRTHRVVVGEPATGRLTVSNSSTRRMLSSRMELPVGDGVGRLSVPSLKPDQVHEELFVVPTEHRAVIAVGPARSVRGDAFGLVRRTVRWTDPEQLYVHPRTTPLSGAVSGFFKDLEGQPTADLSNDDVSFHALRAYVPGDDRRYIHWRTSARTSDLMVRQFEETRRSHVAVGLSTRLADYADPAEFELAVETCASLAVQSFREERRLTILSGGSPLVAPTARRTLDLLSGVHLDSAADGIVAAARRMADTASDVSVAILLCGPNPTPAEIREAGACLPVGVRVIAIRAVLGAATSLRRISDVTVITVGSLDALPRALRAARG